MVVDLKEFISRAPRVTIPTQYNEPVLLDVSQELRFTYDLSKQSAVIQRGEASHTLVGAASPVFRFPAVPLDEIHVYHFLGVHNTVTPGTRIFQTLIQYPQFADEQEEQYQIDTGSMVNMLTSRTGSSSQAERSGRPLIVFPAGIFTICRNGNAVAGDVVRFSFLREVTAGAAVTQQVSNVVTTSEK